MKTALLAMLALALAACVTVGADGLPQHPPNMTEAAKANGQLAMEYLRNGNFELAQEKAQRALSQDDDVAIGHAALAFIYARRNENDDAIREYRKAVSLDPRDLSTRNNFAVFLCDHGHPEDAMETFAELGTDKNYNAQAAAFQNAGVCARRAGKSDKAELYFRKALQLAPQDAETLLQLAALSASRGDWLKVRAFIGRRNQVAPPVADSLKLAIAAERALGDFDAAARYEQQLMRDFSVTPPR